MVFVANLRDDFDVAELKDFALHADVLRENPFYHQQLVEGGFDLDSLPTLPPIRRAEKKRRADEDDMSFDVPERTKRTCRTKKDGGTIRPADDLPQWTFMADEHAPRLLPVVPQAEAHELEDALPPAMTREDEQDGESYCSCSDTEMDDRTTQQRYSIDTAYLPLNECLMTPIREDYVRVTSVHRSVGSASSSSSVDGSDRATGSLGEQNKGGGSKLDAAFKRLQLHEPEEAVGDRTDMCAEVGKRRSWETSAEGPS